MTSEKRAALGHVLIALGILVGAVAAPVVEHPEIWRAYLAALTSSRYAALLALPGALWLAGALGLVLLNRVLERRRRAAWETR